MHITVRGENLYLDHRKAIFWQKENTLIVADIHVGKGAHFRKSGYSMPNFSFQSDIERLTQLITDFQPQKLLILGDLYHSDYNDEFEDWHTAINECSNCKKILILGNHDQSSITNNPYKEEFLVFDSLEVGPFLFTHEPENEESNALNLCGHIHPGVTLSGLGKQKISTPCFYLSQRHFILPAFSEMTGIGKIEIKEEDRVFVPLEDKTTEINSKI